MIFCYIALLRICYVCITYKCYLVIVLLQMCNVLRVYVTVIMYLYLCLSATVCMPRLRQPSGPIQKVLIASRPYFPNYPFDFG